MDFYLVLVNYVFSFCIFGEFWKSIREFINSITSLQHHESIIVESLNVFQKYIEWDMIGNSLVSLHLMILLYCFVMMLYHHYCISAIVHLHELKCDGDLCCEGCFKFWDWLRVDNWVLSKDIFCYNLRSRERLEVKRNCKKTGRIWHGKN